MEAAQVKVQKQYKASVAPHLTKASSIVLPYYTASRDNLYTLYNGRLVPAYQNARPYALSAYGTTHIFLSEKAFPHVHGAWNSSIDFIYRILWPKFRVLYGESVEPQIVRIYEKVANYQNGKKMTAVIDEVDAKSAASSVSSSLSSVSSSVSSAYASTSTESDITSSSSASSSLSPEEKAAETQEKITNDLKNWQDKFAKAADKGSEDLLERVDEITSNQIGQRANGVGESMVVQLEELSSSEISRVKSKINAVVKGLSPDATEEEEIRVEDQISQTVKTAGMSIREKAIAIRQWKQTYDVETHNLVSAAAQNTLAVLDSIRDIGLGEIGMRWAWMDGVTYKDWAKYHGMKDTLTGWRQEVEAVAFDHEGLRKSTDTSAEIESKGMAVAEAAAKELNRLKDVGKWKLRAVDSSDDFSSKVLPAKAAKIGEKVMEGVGAARENVVGSSQGSIESVTSAVVDSGTQAASSVSSVIVGTQSNMAEKASSNPEGARAVASEQIASSIQPNAESIVSAAREKAEQIAHEGSKAFAGTNTPVQESAVSKPSGQIYPAGDAVSSMASEEIPGSSAPPLESAFSAASSAASSASSVASTASPKVFAGAVAQAVKDQKPILEDLIDDDATYSEKLQDFIGQAGDKYAELTRAVNEALSRATTTQGTAESASSIANEKYSSALAAASQALYGTEKGTVESATSVVAGKYSDAVAA